MEIYQPSDDSHLLADFLKKYFKSHKINSYLDMGTGSGILAKTSLKFVSPKKILATDINPDAIRALKNEKFQVVQSDLFKKIPNKFDLITFNVPYLPLDEREPTPSRLATTGGKNGDEISIRFMEQASQHLNPGGKILLLISSLTPMNRLKKFNPKIVAKKKVFAEDLIILEFN